MNQTNERAEGSLGSELLRLRKRAGLSQTELALLIGSGQSAVAKREQPDYDGHSTRYLRRVAEACGYTVVITFHEKEPVVVDIQPLKAAVDAYVAFCQCGNEDEGQEDALSQAVFEKAVEAFHGPDIWGRLDAKGEAEVEE